MFKFFKGFLFYRKIHKTYPNWGAVSFLDLERESIISIEKAILGDPEAFINGARIGIDDLHILVKYALVGAELAKSNAVK